MTRHIPVLFAVALVAMAKGSLFSAQADKPPDAKELTAVQSIRARIEEHTKKAAAGKPAPYKVTIPNTTVSYSMVSIPGGQFKMGSAGANAKPDEQPQHTVKLDPFWMQAHEVTWDMYLLFMFADQANERANPDATIDGLSRPTAPYVEMSFGRGLKGFPAISMTQHAANKFAEWLSAKTGEYYRLPTEAEWEYACRAGSTGLYSFGDDERGLQRFAWYDENARRQTHAVGTRKPNEWGLFDMHGNVWEWCADVWHPDYSAAPADGSAWAAGGDPNFRVIRGGSWITGPDECRSTRRVNNPPGNRNSDVGFRVVLPGS
jgi:formylglycine-generating enzyme required for sulfatase activity